MNLGYLVSRAAKWYPDNTALVFQDTRLTYRQVNEQANRLANSLIGLGLQKGDRICDLEHNCHQIIISDFACAKAGLVRIALNTRLSAKEMSFIINDSGSSAIIYGEEFAEDIEQIRSELLDVKHYICVGKGAEDVLSWDTLVESGAPCEPDILVSESDLSTLAYTAGTTGRPKGAMRTHRNRISSMLNVLSSSGYAVSSKDVFLHAGPVIHMSGTLLMPYYVKGATHIILPRFDVAMILDAIERERVTTSALVPTMIFLLLTHPDIHKRDLSSLKRIFYGASPMPADKLNEAMSVFGRIFIQLYGMVEAMPPVTYLLPDDHITQGTPEQVRRLKSCGREVLGAEVRVVNDAGEDVRPGEMGEIITRGPHVMEGYWNQPEATAESLRDGWMHTRDMATVDDEGYVYIVDRKGDMIISGGYNVYPREVEEVIYQHPAVLEVAVIGVPHSKWGEAVKAVVTIKNGLKATEDEIIALCRDNLAGYKKPLSVDFIEAMPKNQSGKILRRVVKESYWQDGERMVH